MQRADVVLLLSWLHAAWLWGPFTLAIVFLCFAWRGDPAKGRKRCRKCWHSLDATPRSHRGWICPECGTVSKRERQMLRAAPRPWMRAWYFLFLLAAPLPWYAGVVMDRWTREGKQALIPTTLAALVYPSNTKGIRTPGTFGYHVNELLDERSCPQGDCADLHPFYRWLAGTPEYDFVWFDPMDHIDLPRAWVRNEPIPVDVERLLEHTLTQPDFHQRVTVTNRGAFAFGIDVRPGGWGGGYTWVIPHNDFSRITLPASGADRARYEADIEVNVRPMGMASGLNSKRSSSAVATIDIPLVDTWEEALNGAVQSPVRDPAIDAWLLRTPQLLFYQSDGYILLSGPDRAVREFGPNGVPFDVNLVYEILLIDGDERIHRETVGQAWRFWEYWESPEEELGLRILGRDEAEFQRNLDRMTVRLVPRPRLALTQFEHDVYWMPADGSAYLEMSLREAVSVSPRRGAGSGMIDLLNPPVPFVRQLPW